MQRKHERLNKWISSVVKMKTKFAEKDYKNLFYLF